MIEDLRPLLDRLEVAKFSGTLELRLESGIIASATLHHFLPFEELGRELPTIEPEGEFKLTP
jgi:hypothetical protein